MRSLYLYLSISISISISHTHHTHVQILENSPFQFDHSFDEETSTGEVYEQTVQPLIPFVFEGGRASCFAYVFSRIPVYVVGALISVSAPL